MPKKAKALSAREVDRLTHPGLHAVGGVAGLLLQVSPSGARSWILRIRVGVKRRDIGLGGFPDVTLSQARDKARDMREKVQQGVDPIEEKRAARAALMAMQAKAVTFDQAATRVHANKAKEFRNGKHTNQWINTLQTYASPIIGKLAVSHIELAHIIQVLEPIWDTKTETATRVRQRIEQVLAYATAHGYREGDNPARWRGNLDAVLPKPRKISKVKHHSALPWQEVPQFMSDLKQREGMGARALEFTILTAARSGEVRGATWGEIDLEAKLWTIQAERMKAEKTHRVPLSDAAINLLKALPRLEDNDLVFPSTRGGVLSDMTLSSVTKRMEVDAVPHGFRSSFKDWARSSTAYPDEVSELALAHVNSDATRAAYARDELLPKRTRLMNDWAKYCSTPTTQQGEVVAIRSKQA